MGVAGVGGLGHPDAQEPGGDWQMRKGESGFAPCSVGDAASWESYPTALSCVAHGIGAGEVLHEIFARVRIGPIDANGVDLLNGGQVDDNPLRVHGIILASKRFGQVGIALPIGVGVAVSETRIAVAVRLRKTCVRQGIAERVTNGFCEGGVADEVAFVAVAPCAFGIPVPRFYVKFGVLAVGDGLPAGRKHGFEDRIGKNFVGRYARNAIEASAQCFGGTKRVNGVVWRGIHVDGLGSTDGRQAEQQR